MLTDKRLLDEKFIRHFHLIVSSGLGLNSFIKKIPRHLKTIFLQLVFQLWEPKSTEIYSSAIAKLNPGSIQPRKQKAKPLGLTKIKQFIKMSDGARKTLQHVGYLFCMQPIQAQSPVSYIIPLSPPRIISQFRTRINPQRCQVRPKTPKYMYAEHMMGIWSIDWGGLHVLPPMLSTWNCSKTQKMVSSIPGLILCTVETQ